MPSASLAITYHAAEEVVGSVPYNAQVVSRCDEAPLSGATVYFDGQTYMTDATGYCDLGYLAKGRRCSAVVTHQGRSYTFIWTVPES